MIDCTTKKRRIASDGATRRRLFIQYAVLSGLAGSLLLSSQLYQSQERSGVGARQLRRSMQAVLTPVLDGPASAEDKPSKELRCTIPKAEARPRGATVVASYPGSGAKMTWKIIRALTGLMTGDDHDYNGLVKAGAAVAIKTHIPTFDIELLDTIKHVPRAVILMRNPINALASYSNFQYEQMHNLRKHSTRGPLYIWIKWRDENFDAELANWRKHTEYWLNRYPDSARTIITYERIIDPETGPAELAKLGEGLKKRDERIVLPPEEDLPCIWKTMVSDKRIGTEGQRRASLRKGAANFPYTDGQLEEVERMLRELKEAWPDQIGYIMDEYLAMIEHAKTSQVDVNEAEATSEALHSSTEEIQIDEDKRRLVTAKRARNERLELETMQALQEEEQERWEEQQDREQEEQQQRERWERQQDREQQRRQQEGGAQSEAEI